MVTALFTGPLKRMTFIFEGILCYRPQNMYSRTCFFMYDLFENKHRLRLQGKDCLSKHVQKVKNNSSATDCRAESVLTASCLGRG